MQQSQRPFSRGQLYPVDTDLGFQHASSFARAVGILQPGYRRKVEVCFEELWIQGQEVFPKGVPVASVLGEIRLEFLSLLVERLPCRGMLVVDALLFHHLNKQWHTDVACMYSQSPSQFNDFYYLGR